MAKLNPEDRERGYRFIAPVMSAIFKGYYSPKLINKEVIPTDGPVVIACNHVHLFDQCLTIAATKRTIHYMAKKEYFEGKLKPFFELMGCIAVDRQNTDIKSVKAAMKVLRRGGAIGIFPEGTRNRTDNLLLDFKPGACAIAKKTDAYIVPCGLTGEYKFRSKTLSIRYGTPFKVTDLTLEEANEKLYNEIKKLVIEGKESEKK